MLLRQLRLEFSVCQVVDHVNFVPFALKQGMMTHRQAFSESRGSTLASKYILLRLRMVTVLTLKYTIVADQIKCDCYDLNIL